MPLAPILALLVPALGFAAEPRSAAECRDGSRPVFTGMPFRPLSCDADGDGFRGDAKTPAESELPVSAKGKTGLAGFEGKWGGLVQYAMGRFELQVTVERKGRRLSARASLRDYNSFQNYEFAGALKSGFWNSNRLSGELELLHPIKERLSAKGWLGAAGAGYDREIVVLLDERNAVHRLALAVEGDALRFNYRSVDPKRSGSAVGELKRIP